MMDIWLASQLQFCRGVLHGSNYPIDTECFCDFLQLSVSKRESSKNHALKLESQNHNISHKILPSGSLMWICVLSKCSQVVLCNAILGQSIAFLFRPEALLLFCGISDYLQLCTRYADSIVKLYAVCAVHGLRFQFVFVEIIQIYFIGLVESGLQGHGSDNSVVCYFLQLRSAFSCHGWLLGDIPLHVFVLHTI